MTDPIPKQVLEGLANVPLFSACNKQELRRVARLGTETPVPDGEVLAEQGEPGFEFCLILEGKVRCLIDAKLVATLGAPDFFGEMALIDEGPRSAVVTAETDLRCQVLTDFQFRSFVKEHPEVAWALLRTLVQRIREYQS